MEPQTTTKTSPVNKSHKLSTPPPSELAAAAYVLSLQGTMYRSSLQQAALNLQALEYYLALQRISKTDVLRLATVNDSNPVEHDSIIIEQTYVNPILDDTQNADISHHDTANGLPLLDTDDDLQFETALDSGSEQSVNLLNSGLSNLLFIK